MNELQTYQALLAATQRGAVAKTTRRHVHLSPRSLVVVGYHLAGDPGALLALMWGTSRDQKPHIIAVPEPRNRALRFEALSTFATEFVAYLSQFEPRGEGGVCLDAPQLVVPNTATAEWLGGVVGRFTRNLHTDGDGAAPPSVPLAGKHLSFFANPLPGSSLVLKMTEALTVHWQTGQLPLENLNLAALLGWIDPPAGADGPRAARIGEAQPPAGPVSDPNWDAGTLAALIRDWHNAGDDAGRANVRRRLDHEVRDQLTRAWCDCWRGLQILNTLSAGDHVSERWRSDRKNWTEHCNRITKNHAHFRNIPTPIQAADRLRLIEYRTEKLQHEMACDDRLIMAALVASGEALIGQVVAADLDRRTLKPDGKRSRQPLITIEPAIEFARPAGTTLYLSAHPNVKLEVLPQSANGQIRVQVLRGANQTSTVARLPAVGDEVVLSPYEKPTLYPRLKVVEIPWTHQQVRDGELEEEE